MPTTDKTFPQNTHNELGDAILAFFVENIGQKETSPNRGPLPDRVYKFVVGGDPAHASADEREWCAGTYSLACAEAKVPNPPKTMSSGGIYDHCKHHGEVVYVPRDFHHNGELVKAFGSAQNAHPGDAMLVLDTSRDTGFRHTGCLELYLGDNMWQTIEANFGNAVRRNDTREAFDVVIVRPFKMA